MRLLKLNGTPINVPDAYEIEMTLTDMVMPSKNMFQSINSSKVVVSFYKNEGAQLGTTEKIP
jgi:hypothetical protein